MTTDTATQHLYTPADIPDDQRGELDRRFLDALRSRVSLRDVFSRGAVVGMDAIESRLGIAPATIIGAVRAGQLKTEPDNRSDVPAAGESRRGFHGIALPDGESAPAEAPRWLFRDTSVCAWIEGHSIPCTIAESALREWALRHPAERDAIHQACIVQLLDELANLGRLGLVESARRYRSRLLRDQAAKEQAQQAERWRRYTALLVDPSPTPKKVGEFSALCESLGRTLAEAQRDHEIIVEYGKKHAEWKETDRHITSPDFRYIASQRRNEAFAVARAHPHLFIFDGDSEPRLLHEADDSQ